MDMEPSIEVINSFLEQQIDNCSAFVEEMDMADVDIDEDEDVLDQFFREMLRRVWKTGFAEERVTA